MPILSPDRNKSGNQPLQKGPFFIFLLIMPVFALLIIMILVIMQYKQLRSFVSPQPLELPKIETSESAQEKVRTRLREFLAEVPTSRPATLPESVATNATAPVAVAPDMAVQAHAQGSADQARASADQAQASAAQAQDTLALTATDLNHLIRSSQSLEKLKLDYFLELEDTVLVARNSLPVDRLIGPLSSMAKVLNMKGFLNSEMKGYPSLKAGKVIIVPVSAVMNGIPAPASVLTAKGELDLREWVGDQEFYDRTLAGLLDIRIRGGRLLLIRR